jgi:two-component system response regulator QseB
MKLLLVEDDTPIGEGLVMGLNASGCRVDWVKEGKHALAALKTHDYTTVILDLGLPDIDGLDVLRQANQLQNRPPILVLSARSLTQERIQGLNLGADDYLVKPFDFDELLARLHALHRRGLSRHDPVHQLGCLQVDPLRRQAWLDEQEIGLSPREFDILLALIEKPGAVRSIEWLEQRLYDWNNEINSNAIQVHLHHLRRKLGARWIQNIRGVGYKLELSMTEDDALPSQL